MASQPNRYRITVTPIDTGGLPSPGRCSLEFEQPAGGRDDWLRMVEGTQRLPGLAGDERATLVIGARLLDALARHRPGLPDDPLQELRAPLARLVERLERTAQEG
ncbi:DUF3861 family protein [Pseudoxanthomonas koreensis]|uniref:DUF3861 family protein n=1 Tax=Pseudoxanthomonas koreensis TaxID=266061 RepID=UPI0035A6BDD8